MIDGIHATIFTKDADQARAFFRDVLGFGSVDAGGGWLIFALPPAELGIHPDGEERHEFYLMCDDIQQTVADLEAKGVEFIEPVISAGFGQTTRMKVPGGGTLALY